MAEFRQQDYLDCLRLLDESERLRAERLKIEKSRRQFVIGRGILRQLLAPHLDILPENIRISQSEHGKPYIPGNRHGLSFNVSHSGNRLAVAIGSGCDIGVDIEYWRQEINCGELVRRYFAQAEIRFWESIPESGRLKAFYELWTRKEAFVKAVGRGISLGLDQCVVSGGRPVCFERVPEVYGRACDWKLIDLKMSGQYSGAITANDPEFEMRIRYWK
ncbi:MAG: 4'-phosphopantetheinyl transferase family protein [Gammaproteobacteria bacterium]